MRLIAVRGMTAEASSVEAQRREMGRTWMARMGRAGGNWSSPHARQYHLSWAFAEIHVRREGGATSRNDPKSFYHLNIFLDFLEGEETPEPWACHGGLKSSVSLAAPPFCPRGSQAHPAPPDFLFLSYLRPFLCWGLPPTPLGMGDHEL